MSNREPVFYTCSSCRVIIEEIQGSNCDFSCCGAPMEKMAANTSDAAQEKHLPVVKQNKNTLTVEVGNVFHPMSDEHSIEWIYLQTEKGGQIRYLRPDEEPVAAFHLSDDDTPVAAYTYCNLHGFWKTVI